MHVRAGVCLCVRVCACVHVRRSAHKHFLSRLNFHGANEHACEKGMKCQTTKQNRGKRQAQKWDQRKINYRRCKQFIVNHVKETELQTCESDRTVVKERKRCRYETKWKAIGERWKEVSVRRLKYTTNSRAKGKPLVGCMRSCVCEGNHQKNLVRNWQGQAQTLETVT